VCAPGLPDFSWYNTPKRGKIHIQNDHKIYQMAVKYFQWPQNISNGRKIDQVLIKIPRFYNARPTKIYPNWNFWFENKPSGNPGVRVAVACNATVVGRTLFGR
jgi:hypothetical protein